MTAPINTNAFKSATQVGSKVSFLDALEGMGPEGRDHIKGLLKYSGNSTWDGLKVVPPGSFLEEILGLFQRHTDIPLELPLIATLTQVSGFLNASGASYRVGDSFHPPKLWTVVLAPSGAGKTFTMDTIGRWLSDAEQNPTVPQLANASSAAQFVANVEQCPRGVWFRDEFGQFLGQIAKLQYMEEIKDVLLRAYSGGPIERKTRGSQIEVRDHALSILGVSVEDTFESQIGAESLVDGFAQRFNFLQAEADPTRSMADYPIYFEKLDGPEDQVIFDRLRRGWLQLIARNDLPGAVFDFDPDAVQLFKQNFRALFKAGEVPPSFYRRVMFSTFSYAVVFHAISRGMGTVVGTESVSLALRMSALHLDHARQLLNGYGLSELEKIVRKTEALQADFERQGRIMKPRDLVSRIRSIKTAAQARSILALLDE